MRFSAPHPDELCAQVDQFQTPAGRVEVPCPRRAVIRDAHAGGGCCSKHLRGLSKADVHAAAKVLHDAGVGPSAIAARLNSLRSIVMAGLKKSGATEKRATVGRFAHTGRTYAEQRYQFIRGAAGGKGFV